MTLKYSAVLIDQSLNKQSSEKLHPIADGIRKQGNLNQHEKISYKLTETEAAFIGPEPCPLHLYYGFKLRVFVGFMSVQMSVSLILVPIPGLFSFCWFVLCNLDGIGTEMSLV